MSEAKSGEVVTVICKIPQGMLLQLYKREKVTEVIQGGTRDVTRFVQEHEPIHIRGPAHGQDEAPRSTLESGFAITRVPKDFWDRWMKESGQFLPAVKNGLIKGIENPTHVADVAKENRKYKTGLERIDPNNLPNFDNRFKLSTADDAPAEVQESLNKAKATAAAEA